MSFFLHPTPEMVSPERALRGRSTPVLPHPAPANLVFGLPDDATPVGSEVAYFALGCFWGEEKMFWNTEGVTNTAVGYQGGFTPNPTYEEVCTGRTGHAETVRVCFDPERVTYEALVRQFFEAHDPTQGYRQGNDVGTQYRSALFPTSADQAEVARRLLPAYADAYAKAGYGAITTEITPLDPTSGEPAFWYAEDYHQQYLVRNPGGYCPIHSTGVRCD
ncbi:peptide-methionine (S)-S-oxide reductase [Raineyella antarctica]|uniref:Peptide methionine sulfoxide reductase MsrA n=1 Tax=Raineyella antarctica TaxID=1577474 RepID=A0A1G6GD97_9ACTN|nr:peptide-methionine (S)-S-oxide reductase MsrA [Raineyella antarctica]SDB79940.1 peptide-methionine (S)-S-oxide reductase [Raineyella antarctica]